MPNEKKPLHPEINFLPPLDMVLTFFNNKDKQGDVKDKPAEGQKEENEKVVEKLIEKLNKDN